MSAAWPLAPSVVQLVEWARGRGWTAALSPRGRLRLTKDDATVFVGFNARPDAIQEAARRVVAIDRWRKGEAVP